MSDHRFEKQSVMNGVFAVDSFFLISGLLTSYLFMREVKGQNKPITFGLMAKYYLHRIWRITPAYMLVLFFSIALSRYLGDGPFYPKNGFEINFCRDTWWTNLLVNQSFKVLFYRNKFNSEFFLVH